LWSMTTPEPSHLLSLNNSLYVQYCSNINYKHMQRNFGLSKRLLLVINWLQALNADFSFFKRFHVLLPCWEKYHNKGV
jgi:hypothetical protein